jgi:phosphatidylglycerophosphate synthase
LSLARNFSERDDAVSQLGAAMASILDAVMLVFTLGFAAVLFGSIIGIAVVILYRDLASAFSRMRGHLPSVTRPRAQSDAPSPSSH